MSIDAWKKALATLPSADLSPLETQLKEQFEEGMKLAQAGLAEQESRTMHENRLHALPADAKPAWIVALEMEDVLTANNVLNTCVRAQGPRALGYGGHGCVALLPPEPVL